MVPKGNEGPKAQAKQKPPLLSAPPSRRRECPPNFVRGRERPPTPPTRAPYTADVSVPRLESTVAVKGNQRRRSHKARRGQAPAMGSRPVGCAEFWASASAARRGGIPHEIVRSVQNFRLFLVMTFLQFTGSRHKMLLSYVDLYLLRQ